MTTESQHQDRTPKGEGAINHGSRAPLDGPREQRGSSSLQHDDCSTAHHLLSTTQALNILRATVTYNSRTKHIALRFSVHKEQIKEGRITKHLAE